MRPGLAGLAGLLLLAACGSSEPLGTHADDTSVGVPAPDVEGPITGGLRGRPWAGALQDLAPYDVVQEEYFFSGTAQARDREGVATGRSADYRSRILVQRPRDPARFNGTVLLEWFNVSLEAELPVMWMLAHEELLREGYAYVGVSAQVVGVSASPLALKAWDPLRYAPLRHPGDAYEFDIYAQAARAVLRPASGPAPLGELRPQRIIAAGESQSAALLRTYTNHVQREHRVMDGFLIHTWPGPIGEDVGVPVLMYLTETESAGITSPLGALRAVSWAGMIDGLGLAELPGAGPLRVPISEAPSPDHRWLRVWEIAGGAHGDGPMVTDFLAQLSRDLAAPLNTPLALKLPAGCVLPINQLDGGRSVSAALHQLNRWIEQGQPPASQPRLARNSNGSLRRDAEGFAEGGIRMPNYAVPVGLNRGDTCTLLGSYRPFLPVGLRERYASVPDYRQRFAEAAMDNVAQGTLLAPEAEAYMRESEAIDAW